MEDLRRERIIEYISPEEQENAYLAPSYTVLNERRSDPTYQYTHCDIELSIFGLVELSAPNTNHSPASRITMFTNQKKQTCGWFALNWPFRVDKHTFLQYYCDMPLVKVFSDNITYPNGQNIIIGYQIYTGLTL
jgi:DNA-directed RNA polymerase beta subunit